MKQLGVRVFVSYSSADTAWVRRWLVPGLERRGVSVVVDYRDFDIGAPVLTNIERGVSEADRTLLVVSPDWVRSEWTAFEALLAQSSDPAGVRSRMIPIMFRECSLPSRIAMFTYADFRLASNRTRELGRVIDQLPDTLVRHGRSVSRIADFAHIFRSTTMIDRTCFGEQPHYVDVDPSNSLALTWVQVEPDIYTLLVDRAGRTRGYLNALPVDHSFFQAVLAGRVQDNRVPARSIVPFAGAGRGYLYIMGIAVLPELRGSVGLFAESLRALLDGLLAKLQYHAEAHSFRPVRCAAIAWTDAGIRLCELFGMRKVRSDHFGHPVYVLDLTRNRLLTAGRQFPAIGQLLRSYERIDG
jgi:hypothetical protein